MYVIDYLGGKRMKNIFLIVCIISISMFALSEDSNLAVISNTNGAYCMGHIADLKGELVDIGSDRPEIVVCWGTTDGKTAITNWQNTVNLGKRDVGEFKAIVMRLKDREYYYYRCYATNSAGISWATNTAKFRVQSLSHTPEEVEKIAKEQDIRMLKSEIEHAKAVAEKNGLWFWVIGLEEELDFVQRGIKIDGWDAWKKEFKAEVLDPPFVFDIRDEVKPDISNVTNALKLIFYSRLTRKDKYLLEGSDESGRKEIQEWIGLSGEDKEMSLLLEDQCTKVTILMTARKRWKGYDYFYFLYRRENPEIPIKDCIFLSYAMFKEIKGKYYYTCDLSGSDIEMGLSHLGFSANSDFGMYEKIFEKFKDTKVPEHFYTIEK